MSIQQARENLHNEHCICKAIDHCSCCPAMENLNIIVDRLEQAEARIRALISDNQGLAKRLLRLETLAGRTAPIRYGMPGRDDPIA